MAGNPQVPAPPFDPSKLHPPLTRAQRDSLMSWYTSVSGITLNAAISDAQLLNRCKDWVAGKGTPVVAGPLTPITEAGQSIATGAVDVATTFTSWAEALKTLIEKLFDPHFWLRFLEVGIGAVLIGVGLAHMTNAGETLSKIPVYGKMIP